MPLFLVGLTPPFPFERGGQGHNPPDVAPKVHIKELLDCGFLKIMIYCLCQKVKERGEIELPVGVRTLYI